MKKLTLILLSLLLIISACSCDVPSKEPVIPTPDGIVCNNDVFADLETSSVLKVGYFNLLVDTKDGFVYRDDIAYDFVKCLKEETFYEGTPEEQLYYGNTIFVIFLKNGKKLTISIAGKYLHYSDQTYTGYSSDLLKRLLALFD